MKLLLSAFGAMLVLGIAYVLLVPSMNGCGEAWVSVRVRAIDASTRKPVPGATVTLISESRRTRTTGMPVVPPTILTALTDHDGYATVKDMFGAGFNNWSTSIGVGSSSVRCEAAGYSPNEERIASTGHLRFRDFLIYKQPSRVELSLPLTRP